MKRNSMSKSKGPDRRDIEGAREHWMNFATPKNIVSRLEVYGG